MGRASVGWFASVVLALVGCSSDLPSVGTRQPSGRPPGLTGDVVAAPGADTAVGDRDTHDGEDGDAELDEGTDLATDTVEQVDTTVDTDAMCTPTALHELACDDLVDDDCNGQIDRNDPACAWWNQAWGVRTRMSFENAGAAGPVEGFPLFVAARWDEPVGTRDTLADELRFVDADGTELPVEIEYLDGTGEVRGFAAWVRVPGIDASDQDFIWLYRDNPAPTPGLAPTAVWAPEHSSVYHLDEVVTDEETSGIHLDSTASANHATQGGNDDADGILVRAQYLGGSSDYISIPPGPVWQGSGAAFSIDLLFAPPSGSSRSVRRILRVENGAHELALDWEDGSPDTLRLHGSLEGRAINLALDSVTPDAVGFAMVTFDGQTLSLHHLGVTASTAATAATVPGWASVTLGASGGVGASVFVDEVHFATEARSVDWYTMLRRVYVSAEGIVRFGDDEPRPQ